DGRLVQLARHQLERLLPHLARDLGVDLEARLLVLARAPRPELDPAVRQDVERSDALRDADGMVELVWEQDDAVADADALRALRDRGGEDLRGRGSVELGRGWRLRL